MKIESLCVFLPTGKTFTFKEVSMIQDNQSVIMFTYRAVSDSRVKEGSFYKDNIAGVSKCWVADEG